MPEPSDPAVNAGDTLTQTLTQTRTQRSAFPVLVPEAHAIGMIAVIRSLGRAGYPVHAAASRPDALGLQSKFAAHAVHFPLRRTSYTSRKGINREGLRGNAEC